MKHTSTERARDARFVDGLAVKAAKAQKAADEARKEHEYALQAYESRYGSDRD